jgi:hypothetical protein
MTGRISRKRVILVLCLTLASQAYADRNIVKPSNVSDAATKQALDELEDQRIRAQQKYDQEMLDQSNRVNDAIQSKMIEEQRLQQMLAIRQAGVGAAQSGAASDIEQVVHRVDPDLAISATTNGGVVRYRIALKDWAQRDRIYDALDGVQKLGVSSIKEPPSITVAVNKRSLTAPRPIITYAQSALPPPSSQGSGFRIPQLQGGIRDAPVEIAEVPQPKSNLIPIVVLSVLAFSGLGLFGLWRLSSRRNVKAEADYWGGPHPDHGEEPVNTLKGWVGRQKN